MKLTYHDKSLDGIFRMTDEIQTTMDFVDPDLKLIHILWNKGANSVQVIIDNIPITIGSNQAITLTYYHTVKLTCHQGELVAFSFNREFYCIQDHDQEVSCNGVIFFGTQELPLITLEAESQRKFNLLLQVFIDEFKTTDNIQGEMLRMLLKRLIILFTRIVREQLVPKEVSPSQIEIIRKFNVLVDLHFRDKRNVSDYAELLFRSPKTLANLFKKYNQKSPLSIIHERIVLEAKRLILFTDKQTQEIAYELGFEDPAHFSRFFKKIARVSPSEFKFTLEKTE